MSRRTKWAALFLLLGVGTTLGLVIVEVLSRKLPPNTRSYMVGDPVLHHRLRTNDARRVLGVEFKTNSLGLRDREYAIPKPPSVFRILMLGDSFTEGGGLPIEATVPKQLESQLNRRCGPVFEVINAGVASYSPILEYLLLKTVGLALHPDLVVLEFDMTDLKDDLIRTATAKFDADGRPVAVPPDPRLEPALLMPPIRKPRWLRFLDPLEAGLGHSKLYYDLRRSPVGERLLGSLKLTPERLEELGLIGNVQYDYGAPTRDVEGPQEREAWARSERYLEGIRDLAWARGIPFVLVINPHPHQVSALESPVGRSREGVGPGFYRSDRPFRRLENFGRRQDIPVINPLPLLRKRTSPETPLFKYDDIHHTPAGARVVTEAVWHGLVRRELIPCRG